MGGGICQVSTTLYNAVIRAELEVTQRAPHSMVVTYVDLSGDAAIAGDYKDLKIIPMLQFTLKDIVPEEISALTFMDRNQEQQEERWTS